MAKLAELDDERLKRKYKGTSRTVTKYLSLKGEETEALLHVI